MKVSQVALDLMRKRAEDFAAEPLSKELCALFDQAWDPRVGALLLDDVDDLRTDNERLREALAKALDVLVLPGHAFSDVGWMDAITMAGRRCEPFTTQDLDALTIAVEREG